METKNGKLFLNKEDAQAQGVPDHLIQEIDVQTIPNGPFMGRRYVIGPDGKMGRRVKPDMPKAEVRARWEEMKRRKNENLHSDKG
jgi:hypothetical protein